MSKILLKLKSYDNLMLSSFDRIKRGIFFDSEFKPLTKDFLDKILIYLEIRERYEDCQLLKEIIEKRFDHNKNYKTIWKNTLKS